MKEMKLDEARRGYAFIRVLGITVLVLLMLVSIAAANPYAYIPNQFSNTVSVIDTSTNTIIATVYGLSSPAGVAVTPDGKRVYVTSWSGSENIHVIDTATYEIYTILVSGDPRHVAVSPDGKKVYVAASYAGTVSEIDVATSAIHTVLVGSHPNGIAVTPDGTKVYVANNGDKTVSVIDTATKTVISTVSVGSGPSGVAVSQDAKEVYVTNEGSNTVSVIDTTSNTVTDTVSVGSGSFGVAVTPDGKGVYVTNYSGSTVSAIDTATNEVIATVNVGDNPCGVSVTPDGTKVYVANQFSNNVSVIDTTTNTVVATVEVGSGPTAFGQFIGSISAPKPVLPVANFSTNVTDGYAPLSVQFADLSINSTSRNWDFDNDGNIDSTEETPVHVYTNSGTYTVSLTATSGNGTDSKLSTITVFDKPVIPVADFSASPTIGKAPLTVTFTDKSTGSPTFWSWNFGDKSTSIDQSPVHTYNKAGKYTVSLTVKNEFGSNTRKITNYIIVKK